MHRSTGSFNHRAAAILTPFSALVLALAACGGGGGAGSGGASPQSATTSVLASGGSGAVLLSWKNSKDATSYDVYRSTQAGVTRRNFATLPGGVQVTGVASPYVPSGLVNGTTYYFVVTAINSDGEGHESSEVAATPVAFSGITAIDTGGSHSLAVVGSGATSTCWSWQPA